MARKLRIQYPGAIYHLMNRGDHRERIFCDDQDRQRFLSTLAEGCEKTDWQVRSFCLMLNHFHLVVETPRPNLVGGMKWFLGVYTCRFNRRHQQFGHPFSGRYKELPVDHSGTGYLKSVAARLRRGTTLTTRDLAERLHLGARQSLNNKLYLLNKRKAGAKR